MKGIVCIGILVVIFIVGWIWFRPYIRKVWSRYREGFSVENIEDPVFLFRILFDLAEYNANPQTNHNIPYKDTIMSLEERQDFLNRMMSDGVTFHSQILQVQTSASLPKGHISELENTGLTTIVCDRDHYCLPGSNITIKGIPGLDGTYKNGVSLCGYANEKRDSLNRVDAIYDGMVVKGSALGFLHSFQLIKDTSSVPSIREGTLKGYIESISPEASVEVRHRVYKTMPYNEWLSCVLTAMCYLYGTIAANLISGYATDLKGTVVEEWSQLVVNSSYGRKTRTKNGVHFEPMQLFVKNLLQRFDNQSPQFKKISSMYARNWTNDPYHIVDQFEKYYSSYIKDDYNLIGIPDTFGPFNSINIIPIIHYLKSESVKNLYWGFSGTGTKLLEQNTICGKLNMFNIEEKSISGGTQLEGRLFDWVNPYDYKQVSASRSFPDPQTWIILGGANTEDGRDRKSCYLDHYCGIVKDEFTSGKKVGYIYMHSFVFIKMIAGGCANYFSGELPSGFEKYKSNEFIKAQYAIMRVLAPMMKYLVSEEKCESIIMDMRGNEGGDYSSSLASFFGSNRKGTRTIKVGNDSGFSFPLEVDVSNMNEAFETIWTDLADTFEGSVFRGSEGNPRKVVLLMSCGTTTMFHNYFLGDKGDCNIGENTYSSIIGSKSIGSISQSIVGALNTPTISSNTKFSLQYSLVSGNVRMLGSKEGPLFNKTIYSDGFWNQVYISSEIPDSLKSISGGTSLRNDMDLLYYSFGMITPPSDLFIKYSGYKDPQPENPESWKDPWLEQSIRESISDIVLVDISSIYPRFEWESTSNVNIIDRSSFIIESGQTILTRSLWNSSQYNLQINFIIDSGLLQFDPRGADDRGNTLIPLGNKSENIFIGFFNEQNQAQYGVSISSESYTEGVYAIGFFVGKVIRQFNTLISFPVSISILIQENSQIYFTVNGYHMYQGNGNRVKDERLKIGAKCSNNLKDKKSVIVVKEFSFQ